MDRSLQRDATVAFLVAKAKELPCRYPARGDTCDDHRARGEGPPDFIRCEDCVVRDLAKAVEGG